MQVHIQNDGPVTISLETPPPKPMQQKQVCLLNSILIILFNFWLLPFSSSFLGFSDPGCQRRLCALDSILIGAISVLAHEQALIINALAERFFARGKFEALNRSKRREPARDLGLALILSARLTENLFRLKIFPQEEKRVFCSDDTEGLRESDPRCSSGNRFSWTQAGFQAL